MWDAAARLTHATASVAAAEAAPGAELGNNVNAMPAHVDAAAATEATAAPGAGSSGSSGADARSGGCAAAQRRGATTVATEAARAKGAVKLGLCAERLHRAAQRSAGRRRRSCTIPAFRSRWELRFCDALAAKGAIKLAATHFNYQEPAL